MKKITLFFLMLPLGCLFAQNGIGINTSAPQAQLDIQAKNTDTPENSAGMLFPTVSRFSSVDPAQGQNGMLVFLITQVRQVLRDTISGMIPKNYGNIYSRLRF